MFAKTKVWKQASESVNKSVNKSGKKFSKRADAVPRPSRVRLADPILAPSSPLSPFADTHHLCIPVHRPIQRFTPGSSSQPVGSINFEVEMFARQSSLAVFQVQIQYLIDTCKTAERELKELEDARHAERMTSGKEKGRELE